MHIIKKVSESLIYSFISGTLKRNDHKLYVFLICHDAEVRKKKKRKKQTFLM